MRKSFLKFGFAVPFLALAGCAGGGRRVFADSAALPARSEAGKPGAKAEAAKDAEAAATAFALQNSETQRDYRIAPGDLIDVNVYGDQELTSKMRVSRKGLVSVSLIGPTAVAGLSLLEAEDLLKEKLKKFYVDPRVSLFIEEYGNKEVFVLGEVNKPGSFRIPAESRMTVLEAISNAGGFTPIAGLDRTRILRNVGGKSGVVPVDIMAITKKGEKDKDIVLQPNDVVYVPQSFF